MKPLRSNMYIKDEKLIERLEQAQIELDRNRSWIICDALKLYFKTLDERKEK